MRRHRRNLRLGKGATGPCPICRRTLPLVADHDHATDETRGAICRRCNAGLGFFLDDPPTLTRAADYLWHHARTAEQKAIDAERDTDAVERAKRERSTALALRRGRPSTPLGFDPHSYGDDFICWAPTKESI